MAGYLITLPLRLGVRAARGTVNVSLQASARALSVAAHLARTVVPSGESPATEFTSRAEPAAPAAARASAVAEPETTARPESPGPDLPPRPAMGEVPVGSRPTSEPAPLLDQPIHVSEEPELVAEFAESGAEDGAGAEVTMDKPWDGYDDLSANELIVRLSEADPAELAVVKLYESATRGRETVLAAVDKEFQSKRESGPSN